MLVIDELNNEHRLSIDELTMVDIGGINGRHPPPFRKKFALKLYVYTFIVNDYN